VKNKKNWHGACGDWLSVKESPPEESGVFLVTVETMEPGKPYFQVGWWSKRNKRWEMILKAFAENVSHYARLIQPSSFRKKIDEL